MLRALLARACASTPLPVDSPHILAVIDELATLTAFAKRSVVRRIDQALGILLTQGACLRHHGAGCGSGPGKDVVAWQDLFPYAHRLAPGQPDPGRHGAG